MPLRFTTPIIQRYRISGYLQCLRVRKACNTKMLQRFQGGRLRYAVSLRVATPTILRCRNFRVDVRVTTCSALTVHNAHSAKILEKLQGGRSRYKPVVSLRCSAPTIQRYVDCRATIPRYRNFGVDVRVTNLLCPQLRTSLSSAMLVPSSR